MRQTTRRIALFFCFTFSHAVLSQIVQAQTYTILHNFTGGGDGSDVAAGVTLDQEGRIYGVTKIGGTYQAGLVFRMVHSAQGWTLTPLYDFRGGADGGFTASRVLFGPNGILYGTTPQGGPTNEGTVFSLSPPQTACHAILCPWTKTVLYSFTGGNDGAEPGGDLLFDSGGNIYGTASEGGAFGWGVVYKLTRSNNGWTQSVLWSFTGGDDGVNPFSGPVFDSAGNLYGTTSFHGEGYGAVYELSPSQSGWTEKTLHEFTNQEGGNARGGVTIDANGNLYGMTGPPSGAGDAYELRPTGGDFTFAVLQVLPGQMEFEGPDDTPTLDAQGNLYGTLSSAPNGNGSAFKLTPSGGGWTFTYLHVFQGLRDGGIPIGSVIFDSSGNLYGTTSGEDQYPPTGTVWEITP